MSRPAARITDPHVCPQSEGPKPHVGGPVVAPSAPNVLVGGLPVTGLGCQAICVGPPDTIMLGSFTVLAGGRPLSRLADITQHGGVIMFGFPTVLVGG